MVVEEMSVLQEPKTTKSWVPGKGPRPLYCSQESEEGPSVKSLTGVRVGPEILCTTLQSVSPVPTPSVVPCVPRVLSLNS